VYALAKLGKTKTLIEAAKNPMLSVNLRVLCLGQLHGAGSESTPALVQLAGSKDVKIRQAAINGLYFVRPADDAVIKTFIGALRDDDIAVRRSAVLSLREFWWMLKDRADVLDGIRPLLIDEDENVAAWAYIIYPELGGDNHVALEKFLESAKDVERLRAAARLLQGPRGQNSKVPTERLIEIAEKGLEHKNLSLQMRCAACLARGRHVKLQGKLLDHFRTCAKHPRADVRVHAISLTSYYATSAADIQKEFMTLLDDKDDQVRWTALANMYNIGLDADLAMSNYQKTFTRPVYGNRDTLVGLAAKHGAKALPVLRLALKEKDTRERALQELVNLSQDDKILAEFLAEFRAALADKGTRQTFLRFLAARHNSEANLVALAPELRKLLNEEDFHIRQATVQLLARIQYGKGEVLLQAFDAEPSAARRAEITAALVLYPAPAILERAMKDPASPVRTAVASLLGEPGDKATHKFLVQAMHDPSPEVRRAAAQKLAAKSTPKTIAFLEDLLKQNQSKTRFSALTALTNNRAYRDKTCVKELIACLTDRSPEVRILAIQLLARIGPDTLPMLAKVAAQDVDEDVRRAAKQVLSPPLP
jgi:HEAT repeat protein